MYLLSIFDFLWNVRKYSQIYVDCKALILIDLLIYKLHHSGIFKRWVENRYKKASAKRIFIAIVELKPSNIVASSAARSHCAARWWVTTSPFELHCFLCVFSDLTWVHRDNGTSSSRREPFPQGTSQNAELMSLN